MAYNGYLIKLGGANGTILSLKFMSVGSYKCTPNQRMESQATRAVTGLLHRTTVEHTATKVEFETPTMTNRDINILNNALRSFFTNEKERKIVINYYDNETDSYKDATCYMPDVNYVIDRIDQDTKTIYYQPVRYAFIEY